METKQSRRDVILGRACRRFSAMIYMHPETPETEQPPPKIMERALFIVKRRVKRAVQIPLRDRICEDLDL